MKDRTPPRSEPLIVDDEPRPDEPVPRLLLTNDDGIDSPGLRLLARRLASRHDVVVVAPSEDRSGSGTGIGRFDPRGVGLGVVELDGVEAYAIPGPPGLAVLAAALGAFGRRPDLVVSGINTGLNTGHSVLHSGTVGAALTARTFGGRGLALSLAASDPWRWDTAVDVAERVVDWVLGRPPEPFVLNVNVPAVALDEIKGARWAKLDDFGHFHVATADPGAERLEFDVATPESGTRPDADTALCRAGWVTLTPLATVEAEPFPPVPPESVVGFSRT